MAEEKEKEAHLGFKYLHLALALILGVIWALLCFFQWIVAIDPDVLINFAYGLVGITIYVLFAFIWQIMWRYFHKLSEKL